MSLIRSTRAALALLAMLAPFPAAAIEYPIGTPHNVAGMEIAAVYLQPIEMEPEGMMAKASETDIHLEADIHALANNANGFPEGSWYPYLVVKYELAKQGSADRIAGEMMPMAANDGPHYGDNVKLKGPGRYRLRRHRQERRVLRCAGSPQRSRSVRLRRASPPRATTPPCSGS